MPGGDASVGIRPYAVDDAPLLCEAVLESFADLAPWMPWCHPAYSIEESRAWLTRQVELFRERSEFEFAIASADGRYLGACGLNRIDRVNRRANLGYWVRSSEAGRGVATLAVRLLRDWGFRETDLVRLEIIVAVGNAPSLRVAEKSGAVREGVLRQRLRIHGNSHDAVCFSFVRPEAP